jgi:hypothetical protein
MLHRRHHSDSILHRQRHPRLPEPGIASRRPVRYIHDLPANGRNVVLRQLDQRRARLEVEVWRFLGQFRDRHRHVLDDRRHVRLCRGNHRLVRRRGRFVRVVLRGQFEFRLKARQAGEAKQNKMNETLTGEYGKRCCFGHECSRKRDLQVRSGQVRSDIKIKYFHIHPIHKPI